VETAPHKILIATPTMGGVVKNPYVSTLMETITDLQGRGIAARHLFCDGAEIFFARNFLASAKTRSPLPRATPSSSNLVKSDSWMELAKSKD
jgi:hypothetical protein